MPHSSYYQLLHVHCRDSSGVLHTFSVAMNRAHSRSRYESLLELAKQTSPDLANKTIEGYTFEQIVDYTDISRNDILI